MFNAIRKKNDQYGDVYVCKSTDDKPTTEVGNGDIVIEIDTGKYFIFDADGAAWHETQAIDVTP